MTVPLLLLGVTLSLLASAIAQNSAPASPLRTMVETEQAFAKMSEDRGTREAFMEFIAEDGILFRPKAVPGKQWMREHPLPPSDKRPLLAWQPIFAAVADSEDMGYTTGPWEYKNDIKDAKPSAFGEFITVWKKQPDGSWKFAVDLGISHPQSSGPLRIWQVFDTTKPKVARMINSEAANKLFLNREADFRDVARRQGALIALTRFADREVRVFREGSLPFIGKAALKTALAGTKDVIELPPSGNGISAAGDLAYAYGSYETKSVDTDKVTGQGNFLHIWQMRKGNWQLVLDVNSPLQ